MKRSVPCLLLLTLAAGCARGPASPTAEGKPGDAEAAVREKFQELQAAYKTHDAEGIWPLIAAKSQAEAQAQAKILRAAYEKADAATRAQMEKDEGLSAQELARLTGKTFLRTSRFHHKQTEVAESTIERVTAGSDTATVYYLETDGDHEKMHFLLEDGQWKAWIKIKPIKVAEAP